MKEAFLMNETVLGEHNSILAVAMDLKELLYNPD